MSIQESTAPAGPRMLGRAFRASSQDAESVEMMVMLLDLQDQALPVQRLRDWALHWAQPVPGQRVADLGAGTGTMTRWLADLVHPGGHATGVEPNAYLREIAVERATNAGSWAEFVEGLAGSLPFPDNSLDLVWCERVLQHVEDADAAVADIARVLRPGGRAVLLDTDHSTRIISDVDPDVAARVNRVFMEHTVNPHAARHIPRQAVAAGLELDPDIGSAALIFGPERARDAQLIRVAAAQAVAEGAISQEEADSALAAHQAAGAHGWGFTAVTMFGFLARKPLSALN